MSKITCTGTGHVCIPYIVSAISTGTGIALGVKKIPYVLLLNSIVLNFFLDILVLNFKKWCTQDT